MKFWIDENVPRPLSNALRQVGHECFMAPSGTGDPAILQLALEAHAVIVTYDWDFERYILKEKRPCTGVILLQVDLPSKWEELTARLLRLVKTREEILATSFIVLSCHQAKITPLKKR
jgi:predicted nuclease of predicted toxin-antitoxin system